MRPEVKYRHWSLLFVGEQRSPRAKQLGVTWEDVALCSKTLRDALHSAGVPASASIRFLNLWDDDGVEVLAEVKAFLLKADAEGWTVIGLGQKVQARLIASLIPHVPMIHPAARGTIRKRENYAAHVGQCLRSAGLPLPEDKGIHLS